MNKEELIMKDFLELKEKGLLKGEFKNTNELCEILSQSMIGIYFYRKDLQESFDGLNFILGGALNKHKAIYTVGTKPWEVVYNKEVTDDILKDTLNKCNEYYDSNIETMDDLCSTINDELLSTMSNCACDVFNALKLILNDLSISEDIIKLSYGELKPTISFYGIEHEA